MFSDSQKTDLQKREYVPLAGRKLRALPRFLCKNHEIIIVSNSDNRCFGYAPMSALHPPAINHELPGEYDRFFSRDGLDQIEYTVKYNLLPVSEDKLQLCINLFSFWDNERNARYPI